MFRPLAAYIGLRYTRAKRSSHIISFISLVSMLGIALGVAVLITVISVMNGFDHEIQNRIFTMTPQITVQPLSGTMDNWPSLAKAVEKVPEVKGVSPYVGGQGMVSANGASAPVFLLGIYPKAESTVTDIEKKMVAGSFDALKTTPFGVVIGEKLAYQLGVQVGESFTMLVPKALVTPIGVRPQMRRFKVLGIFKVGSGFHFDDRLVYMNLEDLKKMLLMHQGISGLRLRTSNVLQAPRLAYKVAAEVPPTMAVGNWTQQFGAFFKAIRMEKTMMFIILLLIIAVAAFNLVSSLVMLVTDKRSDIAILRTFGALPRTIMGIFMVQGMVIGLVGTLMGLVGGLLLATHVTEIVNWLEAFFHTQLLSSSVYYLDYLPSRVEWQDLVHIVGWALGMSFVATLYPAWRASRIQPAEALRYE